MAKRKLGLSLIVLLVAAATMVSGTYAWFLVGGFAELFDIGFDVMEAGGGVELKGSASSEWKTTLERADFAEGSFIAEGGSYGPVSSANGTTFRRVGLNGEYFSSLTAEKAIHYNDFTLFARSTTENDVDVGMKIVISGEAASAARVSVSFGGNTTIYALTGNAATQAVTAESFADESIKDNNGNHIIDSADDNNGNASLATQPFTSLNADGLIESSSTLITLAGVSGNAGQSEINVRVWIEGNDVDCTELGENTIAGKNLSVKITFTSSEE